MRSKGKVPAILIVLILMITSMWLSDTSADYKTGGAKASIKLTVLKDDTVPDRYVQWFNETVNDMGLSRASLDKMSEATWYITETDNPEATSIRAVGNRTQFSEAVEQSVSIFLED